MKTEHKELLLKDLCARLPYRVRCNYYDCYEGDYDNGTICGFERREYIQIDGVCIHIEEVKPYLFPLSSMTEEQRKEYESLCIKNTSECTDLYSIVFPKDYYDTVESIDYLYKNHIDVRGLIPMGLAIDATNKNIY